MIVSELTEILLREENQRAKVFLTESQYDWHFVLAIQGEEGSDEYHEIQIGED